MTHKMSAILWGALLFFCLGTASACSSAQIMCRSNSQCINLHDVCNGRNQCSDGSDEDPKICSLWTSTSKDHTCSRGNFYCNSIGSCRNIKDFCGRSSCASERDSKICEMVNYGKLELKKEDTGMKLTEEFVDLLQEAVNSTSSESASSCPMLYTRVGKKCLSFFSPAKIPWAEARQFCLSIKGDLLSLGDNVSHEELLQYMRMSKLTTDYWIGGHYDQNTTSWSWVIDDSPMPLGSPYWATRYSSSCLPRSPPHTDPFSSPAEALPGAPCFNYLQAPAKRSRGWCAAMTYEHYYYFSDEMCQDNRSPLCLYIETSQEIHGNRTH